MQPEILGSHLLVETTAKTALGVLYKAMPIEGPAEIHLVHKLADALMKSPEAERLFRKQTKQWQGLKDLHALNLLDASKAGEPLWYAMEYRQGRILSDVLERCKHEGIPLAVDQSVYLSERLAGALLSISAQGVSYGCLTPEAMLVTFEGEVTILPGVFKDLQTTPLLADPLLDMHLRYQPPADKGVRPPKSFVDIYGVGALLFEFLIHEPFFTGAEGFDPTARLEEARKGDGTTEGLPANLHGILKKSLLPANTDRYADLGALKVDLDQLIASGEYSPTTFNIAFLMHSLFRGEDELETTADQGFLKLDRSPFKSAPAPPAPAAKEAPVTQPVRLPTAPVHAEPAEAPSFGIEAPPSRKGLFIGIAAAAALAVVLVLGYFAFLRPRGPSQAEIQAQQELKKLQTQQAEMAEKMKTLETEKNQLSQQVTNARTEEERKKAQKALDDAQKKLEAQKQEQARLATAAPPVKPQGGRTPQPVPTPVRGDQGPGPGPASFTAPAAPSTAISTSPAAPASSGSGSPPPPEPPATETAKTKAGDFVPLWAVDVKPKAQSEIKISVTQGARQNHASGTIYVEISIDETGKVSEAKIVKGLNPDYGMNDECQAAAAKVKYSPAVKDGVPVKTKMTFPILIK